MQDFATDFDKLEPKNNKTHQKTRNGQKIFHSTVIFWKPLFSDSPGVNKTQKTLSNDTNTV
jgi:hypothetical protein